MCKVAVLMAEGFEEGETLTIVDVLRRLEIECHTFYFEEEFVKGMHGMMIKGDKKFSDEIKDYDMIVLPGGRPGGENLRNNEEVIKLVQYFNDSYKYIAAMCSGTIVLEKAQVSNGKRVTGYTGYEDKLKSGIFMNDVVVVDQNIITSQGPATVYPFVFQLAEIFGKNTSEIKKRLMYNEAKGK